MIESESRFRRRVVRILRPILRFFFPLQIEGSEHLSNETVILCPNHAHAFDPILLIFALPLDYPLRIMAKKQLMKTPILGWFLRKVGVFGIDRGNSDIGAVKTAIYSLKKNINLLIFPEGTRVRTPGQTEAKSGVAMMAIRGGAKLQPVYISPTQRLFRRTRIVFGEAFLPAYTGRKGTAEEYQANAAEVLRRAYALGDSK